MNLKELATTAVTITQVIKTNLNATPEDVVKNILDALPNTSVDDLIIMLTSLAKEYGVPPYTDIYGIIAIIQSQAEDIVSDAVWNNLFQSIAQSLYFVLTVAKGLLPPKWRSVVEIVLDAYDEIKK